jgi:negative regulator of flagellin synthesis FlgM
MFGINNSQTSPNSINLQQTEAADAATGSKRTRTAAQSNTSALDSDQTVKVSSTAGALAQITGQSDVRSEKVAQLQAAIAGGTYNVSSTDVANKLIESMLGGR